MIATACNPLLDAALDYAARGWLVMPLHRPAKRGPTPCTCGKSECQSVGKHPCTAHGLKDASTDTAQIRNWWLKHPTANVGIVTGLRSSLIALDIDPKNGGPASLVELERRIGGLPPTVEAITGSGGAHRFFRHPGVAVVIPNSAGKLGPGLDIRGDGGYVVAAPSAHASGNAYAWDICGGPDESELADVPPALLALIVKPSEPARTPASRFTATDTGAAWLGKALARAAVGSRNDTGLFLATQLRDNGVDRLTAEPIMRAYAERVPQGDHPYRESEAMQTLAGVYATPPRAPAVSLATRATFSPPTDRQSEELPPTDEPTAPPAAPGASEELIAYISDVFDGTVYNASWPWDTMTTATQSLLPGSFCVLGGDPGVGKTFFILQSLRHWHGNGWKPSVYFCEKNRRFYSQRLLAQLVSDGQFCNVDWIKKNQNIVASAAAFHASYIEEIGERIWCEPARDVTLDFLLGWIRDRAREGSRVIVIDPITAADPGAERWTKDSQFVRKASGIINQYGCSLVLVTHPKQQSGRTGGTSSGHDAAGGAAYFRFTDTMIWLNRSKQPRKVQVRSAYGTSLVTTSCFGRLLKTRDSVGAGWEIAYQFGSKLLFTEEGVVQKDVKDKSEDVVDVFNAPPQKTPRTHAPANNLDDVEVA